MSKFMNEMGARPSQKESQPYPALPIKINVLIPSFNKVK